jgi:type IV pilus assembly protein PilC
MSRWRYRALTPNGRRVRGELDAADLAELERLLDARTLLLIDARPRGARQLPGRRRIPRSELIPFCFHLEQLLAAGVPPFESLAALRDAGAEPRLQQVIDTLITDVERGLPLSGAAARQPEAFSAGRGQPAPCGGAGRPPARGDPRHRLRTRAGRRARQPRTPHRDLSVHRRHGAAARRRRRPSSTSSPSSNACCAAPVSACPCRPASWWGFPRQCATGVGRCCSPHSPARHSAPMHWPAPKRCGRERTPCSYACRWSAGSCANSPLARFAALFATLYGAGINVIDALHTATGATANLALRAGLYEATSAIEQGRPISTAFEATQVFPPLVIRMLRLGEHTGALDDALAKVATLYRRDVAEGIARLQAAAEPALTILMGGLLLWIASAVLGPIYELITRLPV